MNIPNFLNDYFQRDQKLGNQIIIFISGVWNDELEILFSKEFYIPCKHRAVFQFDDLIIISIYLIHRYSISFIRNILHKVFPIIYVNYTIKYGELQSMLHKQCGNPQNELGDYLYCISQLDIYNNVNLELLQYYALTHNIQCYPVLMLEYRHLARTCCLIQNVSHLTDHKIHFYNAKKYFKLCFIYRELLAIYAINQMKEDIKQQCKTRLNYIIKGPKV